MDVSEYKESRGGHLEAAWKYSVYVRVVVSAMDHQTEVPPISVAYPLFETFASVLYTATVTRYTPQMLLINAMLCPHPSTQTTYSAVPSAGLVAKTCALGPCASGAPAPAAPRPPRL